ncbi:MAG: hypothetical protein KDH88_05570 [Chromatiales bacterium]|nr:hypothetical protein [Chromatiales bacterium]
MNDTTQKDDAPETPPGCDLAIAAEAFYITNMILAPGLGFLMLLMLYRHCSSKGSPIIAMNHLRQTFMATMWTAIIGLVFAVLIFLTGGYPSDWFWPLLGVYFIGFHIPLSWMGIMGLNKALEGKSYCYPFVGCRLLEDKQALGKRAVAQ